MYEGINTRLQLQQGSWQMLLYKVHALKKATLKDIRLQLWVLKLFVSKSALFNKCTL